MAGARFKVGDKLVGFQSLLMYRNFRVSRQDSDLNMAKVKRVSKSRKTMWVSYKNEEVRCEISICTLPCCHSLDNLHGRELSEYAKEPGTHHLEFWAAGAYAHRFKRAWYWLFVTLKKLIALARCAKERMCAVGGSGGIAAEGSFGRAAKAIYENFEQADRDAKRQRIE